MTNIQLAEMVRETRRAQNAYFRARGRGEIAGNLLGHSRTLERQLDEVVACILGDASAEQESAGPAEEGG